MNGRKRNRLGEFFWSKTVEVEEVRAPMAVVGPLELQPITDPADPDDWRPASAWALASDAEASLTVIEERVAPGDRIPLHRHAIDEVVLYEAGRGEVRIADATTSVGPGSIAFIPAGAPHSTTNIGDEPLHIRAVFPSHRLDIEYLERNPAPGTEGDEPRAPLVYDARTGEVTPR